MSTQKSTIGQTVYKILPSHQVTGPAIVTPLGAQTVTHGGFRVGDEVVILQDICRTLLGQSIVLPRGTHVRVVSLSRITSDVVRIDTDPNGFGIAVNVNDLRRSVFQTLADSTQSTIVQPKK